MEFHAPAFASLEVANSLWMHFLRGDIDRDRYLQNIRDFARLGVQLHEDANLLSKAVVLAAEFRQPVHDCLYLALALHIDCRVVTADKKFVNRFASGDHAGRVVLLEDVASAP